MRAFLVALLAALTCCTAGGVKDQRLFNVEGDHDAAEERHRDTFRRIYGNVLTKAEWAKFVRENNGRCVPPHNSSYVFIDGKKVFTPSCLFDVSKTGQFWLARTWIVAFLEENDKITILEWDYITTSF
jgi:hypothetical protein